MGVPCRIARLGADGDIQDDVGNRFKADLPTTGRPDRLACLPRARTTRHGGNAAEADKQRRRQCYIGFWLTVASLFEEVGRVTTVFESFKRSETVFPTTPVAGVARNWVSCVCKNEVRLPPATVRLSIGTVLVVVLGGTDVVRVKMAWGPKTWSCII